MRLALASLLLLASAPAWAADAPSSVAVRTVSAEAGSAPDQVIAYGSAGPALDGGLTLSLQQEGRIEALLVTQGEQVRAGDRLVSFRASATVSSTYQQAVSALDLARSQREHASQLLRQQLATKDQVAQADKAVSDAQATLDALRRQGAGQQGQSLPAPFDGIVTSIAVAQGDRVPAGAPLLVLTRLDGLVVTVGLEPADRARIHRGDAATMQRLAGGTSLAGTVLRVDAALNPKTRLVDADIAVPPGSILSGEAYRATIVAGTVQGWRVPHESVLTDDQGFFLFQADAGHAARVAVHVAAETTGGDIVQGRLDPARTVIVEGAAQLSAGDAIREGAAAP